MAIFRYLFAGRHPPNVSNSPKTGHNHDTYSPDTYTHTHVGLRTHARTHAYPFNGPFSGTTRVSRYQEGKTNLDFTEARDSEWQWHQLGHMQVCTLLQTDNPSCRTTNSVKTLKA